MAQQAVLRALDRAKQAALDGYTRYVWNKKGSLRVTKKEPPNATNRQYWIVTSGGSARLINRGSRRRANPHTSLSKKSTPWIPVKAIRFRDGKLDLRVSKAVKRSMVGGARLGNPPTKSRVWKSYDYATNKQEMIEMGKMIKRNYPGEYDTKIDSAADEYGYRIYTLWIRAKK